MSWLPTASHKDGGEHDRSKSGSCPFQVVMSLQENNTFGLVEEHMCFKTHVVLVFLH
jgi:hypothetical protein